MRISDWSSDVFSSDLLFQIVRVEILHLDLGDFGQLRASDLAAADLAGFFRTSFQVRGLLDQIGRRGRLGDEREALVGKDGDDGGRGRAIVQRISSRVERSEERRDGKTCDSTCRSGWAPNGSKKKYV